MLDELKDTYFPSEPIKILRRKMFDLNEKRIIAQQKVNKIEQKMKQLEDKSEKLKLKEIMHTFNIPSKNIYNIKTTDFIDYDNRLVDEPIYLSENDSTFYKQWDLAKIFNAEEFDQKNFREIDEDDQVPRIKEILAKQCVKTPDQGFLLHVYVPDVNFDGDPDLNHKGDFVVKCLAIDGNEDHRLYDAIEYDHLESRF